MLLKWSIPMVSRLVFYRCETHGVILNGTVIGVITQTFGPRKQWKILNKQKMTKMVFSAWIFKISKNALDWHFYANSRMSTISVIIKLQLAKMMELTFLKYKLNVMVNTPLAFLRKARDILVWTPHTLIATSSWWSFNLIIKTENQINLAPNSWKL